MCCNIGIALSHLGEIMRGLQAKLADHKISANNPPIDRRRYQQVLRNSAIAGHALSVGRSVNFDNIRVIGQEFSSMQGRLNGKIIETVKGENPNSVGPISLL